MGVVLFGPTAEMEQLNNTSLHYAIPILIDLTMTSIYNFKSMQKHVFLFCICMHKLIYANTYIIVSVCVCIYNKFVYICIYTYLCKCILKFVYICRSNIIVTCNRQLTSAGFQPLIGFHSMSRTAASCKTDCVG